MRMRRGGTREVLASVERGLFARRDEHSHYALLDPGLCTTRQRRRRGGARIRFPTPPDGYTAHRLQTFTRLPRGAARSTMLLVSIYLTTVPLTALWACSPLRIREKAIRARDMRLPDVPRSVARTDYYYSQETR